jgi:hypothetical protein
MGKVSHRMGSYDTSQASVVLAFSVGDLSPIHPPKGLILRLILMRKQCFLH